MLARHVRPEQFAFSLDDLHRIVVIESTIKISPIARFVLKRFEIGGGGGGSGRSLPHL